MKRRSFLKNLATSFAALPFTSKVVLGTGNRLQQLSDDLGSAGVPREFWRRVRQEFQLNPGLIHLNCGSIGATPQLVVDAVANFMNEIESNPAIKIFNWGITQMDQVRALAAQFIGADLEEVALTRNTTEGMNSIATGIDLKPGDQVLTTNHEHGGGMVCWQYLRQHRGIELVYIKMPNPVPNKQQIMNLIREKLTPRTRVCSFSHIETITGIQMPLAEIAAITRPAGILLVCDGAQAPGMINVDVKALGVDTYAFSSHKWTLAPKGSGLLYIRKEVQDQIHPTFLHSGYQSYTASAGTRNVANILGHGVALDFHNIIGRDRVEARCRQLCSYLRTQLENISSLRPLTPIEGELSGGILTCALEKGDSGKIVNHLRQEYQVILKPAQATYAFCEEGNLPRENYNAIRFSTHIFNDEAEIDRVVEILQTVLAKY